MSTINQEMPDGFQPDHMEIDTLTTQASNPFPSGLVATWWWENRLGERRIKEQKHYKLVEVEIKPGEEVTTGDA